MKRKLYIILTIGALFMFFRAAQADGFKWSDPVGVNASKILKIDKIKRVPVLRPIFSGDLEKQAKTVVRVPLAYIVNSPLADCYRNQPLLYGFLTLFTTISLGALGVVFHMIRNDPRFF